MRRLSHTYGENTTITTIIDDKCKLQWWCVVITKEREHASILNKGTVTKYVSMMPFRLRAHLQRARP